MGEGRPELRVLVVDDDAGIRLLLADVLTEASCRVFTASDGAEAVEILEAEPVDLLITDYDMPRMNGLELIRWSQARLPHMTTVMITGHDAQTVRAEGWTCGALRILQKPFSEEHLLLLVGELRGAAVTP
jgi:two-component system chemotaxis response regulator CheY